MLLIHPSLRDKVWQNIALLKTGRTNACEMLHSRDMVAIEDVSPDALPATVDENDSTVQGAQKYQQDSLFAKILLSLCHIFIPDSEQYFTTLSLSCLTVWTLQFGEPAAQKLLDSVIDGLALDNQGALFIVDVNAGVGNPFDGYLSKRGSTNYNVQYVAVMSDPLHAEWFAHTKVWV